MNAGIETNETESQTTINDLEEEIVSNNIPSTDSLETIIEEIRELDKMDYFEDDGAES